MMLHVIELFNGSVRRGLHSSYFHKNITHLSDTSSTVQNFCNNWFSSKAVFLNLVPGGRPQLLILNVSFVRHTFHVLEFLLMSWFELSQVCLIRKTYKMCKMGLQKCASFDQKCLVSEHQTAFNHARFQSSVIICTLFSYTSPVIVNHSNTFWIKQRC